MPAETDLYDLLSGNAAVTQIVGGKVFSDLPDEEVAPPYIYYERINTEMINTIHTGIPIAQISDFVVICFAEHRAAAEDLGDKAFVAAAADNSFVYIGRQGEYDADTRLYAAAIQLQHNL